MTTKKATKETVTPRQIIRVRKSKWSYRARAALMKCWRLHKPWIIGGIITILLVLLGFYVILYTELFKETVSTVPQETKVESKNAKRTSGVTMIPFELNFGASTLSIFIEGALKTHGRGESFLEKVLRESRYDGDHLRELPEISSDSYHQYMQDIKMLKQIGLKFYRFSISWPRILPTGYANNINKEGIEYYSNLILELQKAGIEPIVQLTHFDHPAVLQEELDGWQSEHMIPIFRHYARTIFTFFAHRVKYFITFTDPSVFCNLKDVIVENPRERTFSFPRSYKCAHNILKAHAEVYHLYHKEYNMDKTGNISINLHCDDFVARKTNDQEAAEVAFAFTCDWFAHPIFSKTGDYSDILKKWVQKFIEMQKLETEADMPTFTDSWINKIRGSADFFSLSYVTARSVMTAKDDDEVSWHNEVMPSEARLIISEALTSDDDNNTDTSFPSAKGLRSVLKRIKEKYNNPRVVIMENGYGDHGDLNDIGRIKFIYAHVKEVINAINEDKCNVRGYFYWSLIDGYMLFDEPDNQQYFGLAHVNFNSPNRTRTLRRSGLWLHDILVKNHIFLNV